MNSLINARIILLTVTIFSGMTSCQKEEVKPHDAKQSVAIQHRDGDDEEEAIIMGVVQDGNEIRLEDHIVKLYGPSGNLVTSEVTNSLGEFRIFTAPGEYYIEIEDPQGNSISYSMFFLIVDLNITYTF